MRIWLIAAATAAVTIPGAPTPGPHMHYEIRINRGPMTDADRLQAACDVAHYISDDLKKQRQPDRNVLSDVQDLHGLVCPSEKSN
jgi:hypothetical protein